MSALSVLSTDQTLSLISTLREKLSPDDLNQLRMIAEAQRASGQTTVAHVEQLCFADAPTAAARTKAFQRLRLRLDEAAEASGVALQLLVAASKQQARRAAA